MSTNVVRFLDALPVEPSAVEAVRWITGLTVHVSGVCNVAVPSCFEGESTQPDAELTGVLDYLDDSDCTPDLLGVAWEHLLAPADRRSQGAHFTPRQVADRVVALALKDLDEVGGIPDSVWDPSAGGGAFLLAAARAIEYRSGMDRGEIVSSLFASDIDETALRVCEAALHVWSGGAGRPTTCVADSLLDLPETWPDDFSLIVGNPPFLGQLTSDTARSRSEQLELKERFGDLAAGYVDHSSLFVELGLRHLGACSALALVLPQSFLGAASSAGVRNAVLRSGALRTLWIDDARSFSASVEVIALVAVVGEPAGVGSKVPQTRVVVGAQSGQQFPTPNATTWAPLLARSQGVPVVSVQPSTIRLADVATVTAGFRQHFYGIKDAVNEAVEDGDPSDHTAAVLMTSGSIDPFAPQWGQKPIKFAGNRWHRPWLYLDRIDDPEVRRWFDGRLVPKLLVASQTPVIEVIADVEATMVPSVPVITVEPHDPEMLWHLAAAVSAPTTCAQLVEESAGTGLSQSAIRVNARGLSEVLLPTAGQQWDDGARAAADAQAAWLESDTQGHTEALRILGEAMTSAYGGAEEVAAWWQSRRSGRRK